MVLLCMEDSTNMLAVPVQSIHLQMSCFSNEKGINQTFRGFSYDLIFIQESSSQAIDTAE